MHEYAISPTFRTITPADIDTFVSISRSTFYDAFAYCNNAHDMDLYMEEHLTHPPLAAELTDASSVFMYCMVGSEIAGYFKLKSGASNDAPKGVESIELCRLYVIKEHQNKGLGQAMLDYCFSFAQQRGINTMWLGVWEHNEGAKRLYTRNSFMQYGSHDFVLGTDVQTDYLMMKQLK